MTEALVLTALSVSGRPLFIDPRVVWTAPLANAAILASAWLLMRLLGRLWAPLRSDRASVLVFCFVAATSVLLTVPRLSSLAVLLIATGVSLQGSRWVASRAATARRAVPGTVMLLVAAAVVVGLAHESRGPHQGPGPPPGAGAPNLLLIVLDTVRASNLTFHGYARDTTPGLAGVAKRGVTFERAISTSPWTLPSHASLFTGRAAHELSADWLTPLDGTYPTLAEYLRARGYATGGFVANTEYASAEFGLSRGFSHYEDFPLSPTTVLLGSSLVRRVTGSEPLREAFGYHERLGRKPAEQVNRDLLAWVAEQGGRPFFAFVNYYDAHDPYLPPEPFATHFSTTRPRGHLSPGEPGRSREEIRELVDAYDGALRYLDHHVSRMLDELQRRGQLEDTLVVVTSDHGEEFNEHGLMGHGNSMYIEALHVPLFIVFPARVPSGLQVRSTVSLQDVPATIVGLLGLGGDAPFPGASLARFWSAPSTAASSYARADVKQSRGQPAWYPVMRGPLSSLVVDGSHYIRNWGDGREEYYDLERDRAERNDLSTHPEHQEVLTGLRRRLTP